MLTLHEERRYSEKIDRKFLASAIAVRFYQHMKSLNPDRKKKKKKTPSQEKDLKSLTHSKEIR